MSKLLADRKIGVLLESLYIPDEVVAYQKDFADLGAEVQLMSYLWGQPKARFVSDPNGFDDQGEPEDRRNNRGECRLHEGESE